MQKRISEIIKVKVHDFKKQLSKQLGMSEEELINFDEASNHPYECECKLCELWWAQVGPEKD